MADKRCICVTHYDDAGFGVIPQILDECPYHRGVHPVDRLIAERHVLHFQACGCLGDKAICCDPSCPCHTWRSR